MAVHRFLPFLFLDINTQNDFLGEQALFGIKGAEEIRRNIRDLMGRIRHAGLVVLAAMDVHAPNAPEFASYNLPPHALIDTPGQEKIYESWERSAKIIPASGQRRPWPKISELTQAGGQLVLEKEHFDLFTNPASVEVLRSFNPKKLFLYGATLEHDVYTTALSARTLGYSVTVIKDATGSMNEQAEATAKVGLLKRGVTFEDTSDTLIEISLWIKRKEREKRMRAAH